MKLSCTQINLNKGLSIVEKVISKNSTLPILANILLETDKGRLKLSATDLEIGINFWLGAQITKTGSITVPARLLSGFVNSLPNKKIDISSLGNNLNLKCESFKAIIKGLSSKDFPLIPKIKEKPLTSIPIPLLYRAFSQSTPAVSLSQTRPEISGIFVGFSNNEIKIAATDSYRLAEKKLQTKQKFDKDISIIIPSRTVYELTRVFSEQEGDVDITIEENQILFQFNNINLISRLIEGQFPDYEQIIPKKFKTTVNVLTQDIISAVKTASLFASRTDEVKLRFTKPKQGQAFLEIKAESTEKGSNMSRVKANLEGSSNEIIFNYRYLLDGLQNILTDCVEMGLNDDKSPVVLKPFVEPNKRAKDKNYLYLIMPIKS